jgi:hypothetical protein
MTKKTKTHIHPEPGEVSLILRLRQLLSLQHVRNYDTPFRSSCLGGETFCQSNPPWFEDVVQRERFQGFGAPIAVFEMGKFLDKVRIPAKLETKELVGKPAPRAGVRING